MDEVHGASRYSGAARLPEADIQPAERVDGQAVTRVDHDSRCLRLDDGGAFEPLPRLEIVECVDRYFDPLTEKRLAARSRRARRSSSDSRLACRWRGHGTDRGDARVDEHHLLVA